MNKVKYYETHDQMVESVCIVVINNVSTSYVRNSVWYHLSYGTTYIISTTLKILKT